MFIHMLEAGGGPFPGNPIAMACSFCRVQVSSGVYDSEFIANLLMLLLPVVLLSGLAFALYNADKITGGFAEWLKQPGNR